MIRWISGIALGFLFLAYILLSPSFFFKFGLIIIFGTSIYELIKLRVFSLQSLLAFFLIVTAILCLYSYDLERSLILVAVMISVVTDAFAFFTGKVLGRNKIFPIISPNKTLEGTLSGVFVPSILLLLFTLTLSEYQFLYSCLELSHMIDSWGIANTFLALVFCSLMSIAGDLFASKAKRTIAIKDFGNLLPGHGGILDRIDSHLVCIPIFFFLNSLI